MTTAKNRSVGTVHGTSFSSPIVAAAAAIAKEINPDITAPEFIQALTETCDDVFTEGYDNYTGYGKLNMNRLVTHLMLENNPSAIPVPESRITRSGNTYNIFYVHGMLGEQSKVYAAIYSDDRLAAIKSVDCELGSYASEMEIDFEGELDYAEMFVWSESEHMKYATDKQRIYY
jgi:subtilisin family serine protease